jgi:hypothetical protein
VRAEVEALQQHLAAAHISRLVGLRAASCGTLPPVHIDTSFDFRRDAGGEDPDSHSPTLRSYHKYLWSRELPNGLPFTLDDTTPGVYLHQCSELGEFFLTSDAVIPTFTEYSATAAIIAQIPEGDSEAFDTITYTM